MSKTIISKITTQKKNMERFNIFIKKNEQESYAFSVDQDVLITFGLRKGMEIDNKLINEILYKDEIKKAYNQSLNYLSYRMRSAHEVSVYLKKKEVEPHIIDEVIEKLFSYNFLNDLDFAKAYVRSKKNTSVKGPTVIKNELKEKGVSQLNIDEGLKEYSYEEQLEKAKMFAEKKIAKEENRRSMKELKDKVGQTLQMKGFSRDIINEVFNEISVEKTENEEREALEFHGRKAHRKYQGYDGWEYEQKMKTYLLRKRFSYDLIQQFISEMKDED
ncbi:recombination regulator RecX [Lottiidibacillus patelloidae]|nr:recombination regulator RecX [Lottiidibacillus patelloidae]